VWFWRKLRGIWRTIRDGMLFATFRLARLWIARRDAWDFVRHPVPVRYFGMGSRREFRWYLEGNSTVTVESVEDIKRWLLTCDYQHDQILFHEPDHWQHPEMFEELRKGDCEDHAIWAWRKLKDIGIPARLFSGRVLTAVNGGPGFHAWVVFEQDGRPWMFETVAFSIRGMVRPLDEVRSFYVPHFSVDHGLVVHMHCGYARSREELVHLVPHVGIALKAAPSMQA
jgi:hypothetical protein